MKRKAQGEIITTVLIILLVLAAIVIVWQAVRTTTERASTTVQTQANCIGLDLTIEASCVKGPTPAAALSVKVTRGGDSLGDTAKLRTSVATGGNSASKDTSGFKSIGSASYALSDFWATTPPTTLGSTMTVNTGLVITPTIGDVYSCKGSTLTVTCT